MPALGSSHPSEGLTQAEVSMAVMMTHSHDTISYRLVISVVLFQCFGASVSCQVEHTLVKLYEC